MQSATVGVSLQNSTEQVMLWQTAAEVGSCMAIPKLYLRDNRLCVAENISSARTKPSMAN